MTKKNLKELQAIALFDMFKSFGAKRNHWYVGIFRAIEQLGYKVVTCKENIPGPIGARATRYILVKVVK